MFKHCAHGVQFTIHTRCARWCFKAHHNSHVHFQQIAFIRGASCKTQLIEPFVLALAVKVHCLIR